MHSDYLVYMYINAFSNALSVLEYLLNWFQYFGLPIPWDPILTWGYFELININMDQSNTKDIFWNIPGYDVLATLTIPGN